MVIYTDSEAKQTAEVLRGLLNQLGTAYCRMDDECGGLYRENRRLRRQRNLALVVLGAMAMMIAGLIGRSL